MLPQLLREGITGAVCRNDACMRLVSGSMNAVAHRLEATSARAAEAEAASLWESVKAAEACQDMDSMRWVSWHCDVSFRGYFQSQAKYGAWPQEAETNPMRGGRTEHAVEGTGSEIRHAKAKQQPCMVQGYIGCFRVVPSTGLVKLYFGH